MLLYSATSSSGTHDGSLRKKGLRQLSFTGTIFKPLLHLTSFFSHFAILSDTPIDTPTSAKAKSKLWLQGGPKSTPLRMIKYSEILKILLLTNVAAN